MFGLTLDFINSVNVKFALFPDLFSAFLGLPQGRPVQDRHELYFKPINFECCDQISTIAHAHIANLAASFLFEK